MRWRYRRTQIDRQDGGGWYKALTQELPRRVADAGPRPNDVPVHGSNPEIAAREWGVDQTPSKAASKRALTDKPRAPKSLRGKGYGHPGRPRTQPAGPDEFEGLMRVYRENAAVLQPIMEAVQGEAKQLAVLRTLRDFLARPTDTQACKRWLVLVARVQVR